MNKSGYYYWLSRKKSPSIVLKEHTKEIVDIYEISKKSNMEDIKHKPNFGLVELLHQEIKSQGF
jgi:hypothetical protein